MTEEEAKDRVEVLVKRFETVVHVIKVARERGRFQGNLNAYKDICCEISNALAEAEDELTRSPDSPIVLGQVMALTKLAAHFAPAPAYYEQRIEEQEESESQTIDKLLARLREISGKYETQAKQ